MKTQQTLRSQRLALEALQVETFEVGQAELPSFGPTHVTGIDSTCPCCSEGFTCGTKPLPCTA